jgi:protein required for attachment to host cells
MVELHIPSGALVLVADGRRAIFLKNAGTMTSLRMTVVEVMEAEENPPNREQGTGPADRVVHQSGVRGTSTVEIPDYHSRAEKEFLGRVMNALDARVQQENAPVVLVAPPKALASLRESVTPIVRTVLCGEIAKDLVKEPLEKIAEHLQS